MFTIIEKFCLVSTKYLNYDTMWEYSTTAYAQYKPTYKPLYIYVDNKYWEWYNSKTGNYIGLDEI